MKIALVTYDGLPNLSVSDQQLIPEFAKYNYKAIPEIWDNPNTDWASYAAVIIRNTWDYFTKYLQFIEWLNRLENAGVVVLNPLPIVRKNSHKFYLKEIEQHGFRIIPTFFLDNETVIPTDLANKFEKMVVKPAVSAGSYQTEVLSGEQLSVEHLRQKIDNSDWLLQPFLPEIQTIGEISMLFFGGQFSHSIIKKPIEGDFRVQKQFGGQYLPYLPSRSLLDELQPVFDVLGSSYLFGRIDGVLLNDSFYIMEIEMLEPDLFFDLFPEKVALFCQKAIEQVEILHTTGQAGDFSVFGRKRHLPRTS